MCCAVFVKNTPLIRPDIYYRAMRNASYCRLMKWRGVGGTIPASMGKLPLLREMNATNSQLTGELPAGGVLSGRAGDRGAHFEGTSVTDPSSKTSSKGVDGKGVDGKSVLIGVGSSLGVAAVIAAVVMHQRNTKKGPSQHTQLQVLADNDARL